MSLALLIRPLRPEDIPEVLALQAAAYSPTYHEAAPAFLSRLIRGRGLPIQARTAEGRMAGYLFAHPWGGRGVPALGRPLPDFQWADRLFLHDLTVASPWRGLGLGHRLLAALLAQAQALGLAEVGLVAVAGAARYWSGLGFAPAVGTEPLVGYGEGAVPMRAEVAAVRRILLDRQAE